MTSEDLIYLFHHIHHGGGKHKVHHCGGRHRVIDSKLDYEILHCRCGLHKIDKKTAAGHGAGREEIKIKFTEKCPEGGWHLESGAVI